MATTAELTDPYLHIFTRVPPAGPGICSICHRPPNAGFTLCWSCDNTMNQVSQPVRRMVPISLYQVGDQLHTWLRGYKDDRDDALRPRLRLRVAATLGRFLAKHGACVAPDGWDIITTVPSTGSRAGAHPLVQALTLLKPYGEQYVSVLEAGPVAVGHNRASDDGFVARAAVERRRVLLIDDTFTSGARLQSAASRLQLDGANLVGAVVIGRVFDQGYGANAAQVWEAARSEMFTFETCCLEP